MAGESEEIQGESYDDDADAVHGSDNEEDSDDDSDSDSDEEEVKTIEYEQKTNEEYDLETIEKKTIKDDSPNKTKFLFRSIFMTLMSKDRTIDLIVENQGRDVTLL